jgi:hypothetical protein
MMDLSEKIESFQNALIEHATGGAGDPLAYELGREEIVNNPLLKDVTPRFLRTCRNPGQFWSFIKSKFPQGSTSKRRRIQARRTASPKPEEKQITPHQSASQRESGTPGQINR